MEGPPRRKLKLDPSVEENLRLDERGGLTLPEDETSMQMTLSIFFGLDKFIRDEILMMTRLPTLINLCRSSKEVKQMCDRHDILNRWLLKTYGNEWDPTKLETYRMVDVERAMLSFHATRPNRKTSHWPKIVMRRPNQIGIPFETKPFLIDATPRKVRLVSGVHITISPWMPMPNKISYRRPLNVSVAFGYGFGLENPGEEMKKLGPEPSPDYDYQSKLGKLIQLENQRIYEIMTNTNPPEDLPLPRPFKWARKFKRFPIKREGDDEKTLSDKTEDIRILQAAEEYNDKDKLWRLVYYLMEQGYLIVMEGDVKKEGEGEGTKTWSLIGKCQHCGATEKKLQRCSTCKTALYCGKECQTLDWTQGNHKIECEGNPYAMAPRKMKIVDTGYFYGTKYTLTLDMDERTYTYKAKGKEPVSGFIDQDTAWKIVNAASKAEWKEGYPGSDGPGFDMGYTYLLDMGTNMYEKGEAMEEVIKATDSLRK